MAERTAHNGFVVGSSPAKPKKFMKFELKDYKFYKIEKILKESSLLFFYQSSNLNFLNWIYKIEQILRPLNLNYYRVQNTFTKKIIKRSIFLNILSIINSNILLIKPDSINLLNFKKLLKLSSILTFLGLKLNNKFYNLSVLNNLNYISYTKNITLLYIVLKSNIKKLSIKLKKV